MTVTAAQTDAMHEAIRDGATGLIVPQDQCESAMIERILALDANRDLLARISATTAGQSHQATQELRDWLAGRLPPVPRAASQLPRVLQVT